MSTRSIFGTLSFSSVAVAQNRHGLGATSTAGELQRPSWSPAVTSCPGDGRRRGLVFPEATMAPGVLRRFPDVPSRILGRITQGVAPAAGQQPVCSAPPAAKLAMNVDPVLVAILCVYVCAAGPCIMMNFFILVSSGHDAHWYFVPRDRMAPGYYYNMVLFSGPLSGGWAVWRGQYTLVPPPSRSYLYGG